MAEGTNVGKLTITISGDTKDLEAAAKRVGQSLKGVEKSTQDAARTSVSSIRDMVRSYVTFAAGVGVAMAAVRAFQSAIDNVTALDHLSQATGISIQRLHELRGIALQTGIQFETLAQAASQWGTRITQALASSASTGAQAIRALGISVRDAQGNIRQLDEMLPELAERFSGFQDGANKAALAAALFGEEAGPRLIPLLNRGRAGLEDLRRAIGTTVTPEDAQRAREYQQAVGQLQLSFERLVRETVRTFGPTLVAVMNAIADALNRMGGSASTNAATAIAAIERQRDAAKELRDAMHSLLTLQANNSRLTGSDGWFALFGRGVTPEMAREQLYRVNLQLEQFEARLRNLRRIQAEETPTPAPTELPQAPQLDPDALAKAQFAVEQWLAAASGQRTMLEDLNAAWQTHADIVAGAVERINAVQQSGAQREMQIARIRRQLAVQYEQQIIDVARTVGQAITALWPKSKGAAIATAIINTAVGITEAMKLPYPLDFIKAAAVAAMGAAQIATIRSTNADGSGGGGGTSAGAAAAAPTAPAEAAPSRSLTIQGVDPAAFYSGAQVGELIRAINNEVQNGVTLIASKNLPI